MKPRKCTPNANKLFENRSLHMRLVTSNTYITKPFTVRKKEFTTFVEKFLLAVICKFKDGFLSSNLSPDYCISQQSA
jgi:hypothetical protein